MCIRDSGRRSLPSPQKASYTPLPTPPFSRPRPLQDYCRRPGTGLHHPRWPAPLRQTAVRRPSLRHAWTRLQSTASPFFGASLAGTPTTFTTYPSTFRPTSHKYALNSFSTKSPPFHVTVDISPPPERLEVDQIAGHQLVRGRGGVIAVMYETHWAELLSLSWEHERDLQHHRPHILRYRSGIPSQHCQTNPLYRQMRIGAAHRELSRSRGEVFPAPGYSLVPRNPWLSRFSSSTLPAGAHLWYKARNGSGGSAKSAIAPQRITPQPNPTSSASSTTQGRSRSTSCYHFATLRGAPSKVPGIFSVIRPEYWLTECYGMLMDLSLIHI